MRLKNGMIKKLSSIIFYDNLGSLKDRAFRIVDLCEVISIKLNFKINSFKSELIYSNFDFRHPNPEILSRAIGAR